MKKSPAFTLIEILITIALVSLVSLPLYLNFSGSLANQNVVASSEEVAEILRQAHIFSRESRGAKTWGVRNNSPTQYQLVSYTTDPDAVLVESEKFLGDKVQFVSNFTVWFEKNTGDTSDGLDIIIELESAAGLVGMIEVKRNGVINVGTN